ncbi:energy transducer TonB [Pseudomonas sp.]|uniref:energy transducer TonB n=1 Tax=Pseudomonas sp. TaxID=306 RepID=UPI003BB76D16
MTAALLPVMPLLRAPRPACGWCRNAGAALGALVLHGLVLVGLLGQWQSSPAQEPEVRTLTTQLISLAPPAAPAPPPPEPVVVAPEPAPVKPALAPPVEPRVQPQQLEHAALARQRVAEREQKQKQERQAQEQQRLDQQRRAAAEQLAQQQAQQRLAEQQVQAAEHARQAEAAAAASRQYLPIAKEAPDYPDRALDKGIEGDCSVTYTVTPQGRVADPQVAGDCHPLFVRPSLAAAKTFRYQPRIVAGQAVAVVGVKNTFHYRIE